MLEFNPLQLSDRERYLRCFDGENCRRFHLGPGHRAAASVNAPVGAIIDRPIIWAMTK